MELKENHTNPGSPQIRPKATTSAILGNTKGEVEINAKWQRFYQSLLDLRDRLREQKGQLVQAAAEAYTGPRRDPADVGTNVYDCDWALGMASSDQNALYEIDEALNRIRSGGYGICQLTGKPIDADRLRAVPWTRFSTEAERELETTGQLDRARLGHLQFVTADTRDGNDGADEEETEQARKETATEARGEP